MVARAADAETVTHRHLVVHGERAATAGRLAQHRDAQRGVRGPAAQRVLAQGTVGQFLDFWLENDVRPNRSPGTYKSYADTIRLHVRPRGLQPGPDPRGGRARYDEQQQPE